MRGHMTKEESRAISFVGILLLLAVMARFASRPKPLAITASPIDLAAFRAAGKSLEEATSAPTRPKPKPRREMPAPSKPAEKGPIDLNRATAAEMEALPGIGPAVAARIIARRDTVGRFEKVEDLDPVKGIGPALIEKLRAMVVFR